MANNDLDFVQSAIDGELPAGITVVCEPHDSGGVLVTGSKAGKTHNVLIRPGDLRIIDSSAFIAAIRPRILELREALNGAHIEAAAKQAKRKAKKKAKKRVKPVDVVPPAGAA